MFFSNVGNSHFNYTDEQRKRIISWFWKASFTKRYSAGTTKNINKDIEEIVKLKLNPALSTIDNLPFNIDTEFFLKNSFTMNTVVTKAFVLLLAQNAPKSFLSGADITLSKVLKDYNRNEFHHIYPKAYVNGLNPEVISYSVNALANFCILSRADNKKNDCKKTSIYRKEDMPKESSKILASSFINEDKLIADDFDEFLRNRAEIITKYLLTMI